MEEKINQSVERAMHSLDGIERAQAPYGMITRIYVEIQKKRMTMWERVSAFFSKPAVALASIIIIIGINVILIYNKNATPTLVKQVNPSEETLFYAYDIYNSEYALP